jgi:hypothetical protein
MGVVEVAAFDLERAMADVEAIVEHCARLRQ